MCVSKSHIQTHEDQMSGSQLDGTPNRTKATEIIYGFVQLSLPAPWDCTCCALPLYNIKQLMQSMSDPGSTGILNSLCNQCQTQVQQDSAKYIMNVRLQHMDKVVVPLVVQCLAQTSLPSSLFLHFELGGQYHTKARAIHPSVSRHVMLCTQLNLARHAQYMFQHP